MTLLFIAPALLLLAVLSYAQHRTAVTLLTALLPTYLLRFSVAGLPTNALEAAAAVILVAGALKRPVRQMWAAAVRRLPLPVLACILLFLAAVCLSTAVSPHLKTSLGILKGWVIFPLIIAWLVFAVSAAARPRRAIQQALVASGIVIALVGLSQAPSLPRVRAIYDVPNSLALFLTPLAALAWWQKRYTSAATVSIAIIATQSAAALSALVAALAAGTVLWRPPRVSGRQLSVMAALLVLAGSYFAVTGRLAYLAGSGGDAPTSIDVRRQLWSISAELIQEEPVLGLGLGVFEPAYQQKLHQRFSEYHAARLRQPADGGPSPAEPLNEFVFRDPHNWLLSFWLNTGLLGLLSFICLHLAALSQMKGTAPSLATQALVISLGATLLFGLTDTIYWKNDLAALHWLLLALLLNQIRADRVQNDPSEQGQSNTNKS